MLAEYLMAVFRSEVVDIGACGCRYATVRQGPGTDWEGQDAHQLGATHLEKLTRHGDVAHAADRRQLVAPTDRQQREGSGPRGGRGGRVAHV